MAARSQPLEWKELAITVPTLQRALRICEEVGRGARLTDAASTCGLTDETATKTISKVEAFLGGVRILSRKQGSSARITPDVTERFVLELRPVLNALVRLLTPEFFRLRRVRLGIPPSGAFFFLPHVVESLQSTDWPRTTGRKKRGEKTTPSAELEVIHAEPGRLFEMLEYRLLDAVIETEEAGSLTRAAPKFQKVPLISNRKVGLIFDRRTHSDLDQLARSGVEFPRGYPFSLLKGKTVILLREEAAPDLYRRLLDLLPRCKRLSLTTFAEIQHLVERGLGVGLGFKDPRGELSPIGFIDAGLEPDTEEKQGDLGSPAEKRPSSLVLYLRQGWEEKPLAGGLSLAARAVKDAILKAAEVF